MTSNNETVSRQVPWAGNIAKAMTSNRKQFTVTREMLTAVAHDGWNLSRVFKFCFCLVLLYNKSLNDWSLGEHWILFPSNLNVSLNFVLGNVEILGKQNSLFPSGPVIKCLMLHVSFSVISFAFIAWLIIWISTHWQKLLNCYYQGRFQHSARISIKSISWSDTSNHFQPVICLRAILHAFKILYLSHRCSRNAAILSTHAWPCMLQDVMSLEHGFQRSRISALHMCTTA